MKVSNANSSSKLVPPKDDLDRLKRQKSNLIDAELVEIDNLKNYYSDKKTKGRQDHEKDLEELKGLQQKELLSTIEQHQQLLTNKLDEYKAEQQNIEKARTEYISQQKALIAQMKDEHAATVDQKHREAFKSAEDITEHADAILAKARLDNARAMAQGQKHFSDELDKQAQMQDKQIQGRDTAFKLSYNNTDMENSKMLNQQKQSFKKSLNDLEVVSSNKIQNQSNLYQAQLNNEKAQYEALLEQQRETFAERFKSIKDAHDQVLNSTQDKLTKDYLDATKGLLTDKKSIEEKSKDPFYRPVILNESVKDVGRFYDVELALPSHEREYVKMNANGRQIKLSLSRQYSEEVDLSEGTKGTSKKSETISKEFQVPEIVEPKSIVQRYENGKVIFRINKA